MKAYHITSLARAKKILQAGLFPREEVAGLTPRRETEMVPERSGVVYGFLDPETFRTKIREGVVLEFDIPDGSLIGDYEQAGRIVVAAELAALRARGWKAEDLDILDPRARALASGYGTEEDLKNEISYYRAGLVPIEKYKGQFKEPEVLVRVEIPYHKISVKAVRITHGASVFKYVSSLEEVVREFEQVEEAALRVQQEMRKSLHERLHRKYGK